MVDSWVSKLVVYWAVYGVGMTVGSWAGQKVLMKVLKLVDAMAVLLAVLTEASWVLTLASSWVAKKVESKVY